MTGIQLRAGELAAGAGNGPALAAGYTAALVVAAVLQVVGAVLALVVLRQGKPSSHADGRNVVVPETAPS